VAESVLQKQLMLGELLDLQSFTHVCKTFVDLYKIGLKVFDAQGTKLVDMKVASGDFCAYMFTGPNGRRLCTETVTHIKVRPLDTVNKLEGNIAVRNCFSGLRYLMMPILYEGDLLGRIIFGPFLPAEVGALGADLKELEGAFDLSTAKAPIAPIRRSPDTHVRRILQPSARTFYILELNSAGAYRFVRATGSNPLNWLTLIDWTPSSAIQPGYGSTNTFLIVANGSQFRFYLNRQLIVTTFTDSAYTSGLIGFLVGGDSAGGTEAVFSNVCVFQK